MTQSKRVQGKVAREEEEEEEEQKRGRGKSQREGQVPATPVKHLVEQLSCVQQGGCLLSGLSSGR
ncbi:Hypothetical predicted protein, partial [Xyrichtys novacula]